MQLSNYEPILDLNIHATTFDESGKKYNFICVNAPCNNRTKVNNGTIIGILDGNTVQATHIASLDLTYMRIDLPPQALKVSIFPGLQRTLISLGMLCDAGLTVLLTSDSVSIMKDNKAI